MGLIKCSQNPQLYFHMSEVVEKKKLELNEKVDFSLAPVSEALRGGALRSTVNRNPMRVRPLAANTVLLFFLPSMKRQRVEYRPSGSNATLRASSYLSVNWGVWGPTKEK